MFSSGYDSQMSSLVWSSFVQYSLALKRICEYAQRRLFQVFCSGGKDVEKFSGNLILLALCGDSPTFRYNLDAHTKASRVWTQKVTLP